MNLPRRLPYEILIAACLAVGSCSDNSPHLMTRDEVTDIADDAASQAIDDSDKLSDLESRIEVLEQKLGQ